MTLYFTFAFTSFPILEENFAVARFPFQDALPFSLNLLVCSLDVLVLMASFAFDSPFPKVHTSNGLSICLFRIFYAMITVMRLACILLLFVPLCFAHNAFVLSCFPYKKTSCSRYFYSTTRGFLFQCPFLWVQFSSQ